MVRVLGSSLLCGSFVLNGGCSADEPFNPSFALVYADAKAVLREMQRDPKPLQRPLIVVGGVHDPGFIAPGVVRKLQAVTSCDDRIISVSFFGPGLSTFEACGTHLVDAVEQAFPSPAPDITLQVDVVGFSLGRLVARLPAVPNPPRPRLPSHLPCPLPPPHRGARLASLPTADQRTIDMRPGSAFLADLDSHLSEADYELLAYTRLGDMIVGPENASPPGMSPWWVANAPFSLAHLAASTDPRIIADIARRLRNEPPFTTPPASPLPDKPLGDENP